MGGSSSDLGYAIVVDSAGAAYITGCTDSIDFPTVNAYDGSINSGIDVFVTKLNLPFFPVLPLYNLT